MKATESNMVPEISYGIKGQHGVYYNETEEDYFAKNNIIVWRDGIKLYRKFREDSVKRLSKFLAESKKINKKIEIMFNAAKEIGYEWDQTKFYMAKYGGIKTRRRQRDLILEFPAKRQDMRLLGTLWVKPCVVRLLFAAADRKCDKPVYVATFYRNHCQYDNYLFALVNSTPLPRRAEFDQDELGF